MTDPELTAAVDLGCQRAYEEIGIAHLQHSPLPWRVVDEINDQDRDWREIRSNLTNSPVVEADRYGHVHGGMTYICNGVRIKCEDAVFICRACNSFHDLLAAVQSLLPYAVEAMAKSEYPCPAGVAVNDAEAAIAKARGTR